MILRNKFYCGNKDTACDLCCDISFTDIGHPNWALGQPGDPLGPEKCAVVSRPNNFTFESRICSKPALALCESKFKGCHANRSSI